MVAVSDLLLVSTGAKWQVHGVSPGATSPITPPQSGHSSFVAISVIRSCRRIVAEEMVQITKFKSRSPLTMKIENFQLGLCSLRVMGDLSFAAFPEDQIMSTPSLDIAEFLPGRFTLTRGSVRDYDALAPFHYLRGRPATFADIRIVRYHARDHPSETSRLVAVGVLSYPIPSSASRERFLNREHFSRRENLDFANRHIRTISRVIVHPQFRSLGLSTLLVRCLCRHCTTRYVEAIARMGQIHPFFQRAGMRQVNSRGKQKPVYFIFDRKEKRS
jgi:hypothetical protein